MPRSGPGPAITISLRVTVPESALSRPAIRLINVVFPAPENPTMATNSPFSIARLMSFSTSLRAPLGPKPFETCLSSRKGIKTHAKGAKDAKEDSKLKMRLRNELEVEEGFRADLVVEDKLIVELKSVEKLAPIHGK